MVKVTSATFFLASFSVNMRTDATTKRKHQTQALMGATRLASGIKAKAHTSNKSSQTALITCLSVNLCLDARRETRLLKNAPMLGKENCYKYFRISLKMSSFTSNNTL